MFWFISRAEIVPDMGEVDGLIQSCGGLNNKNNDDAVPAVITSKCLQLIDANGTEKKVKRFVFYFQN